MSVIARSVEAAITHARAQPEGVHDTATWCAACWRAWTGHVEPPGHTTARVPMPGEHQVGWLTFTPDPPPDDACHCCDDWKPFGAGQAHFGYCWWRDKAREADCDHEHHAEEVWFV